MEALRTCNSCGTQAFTRDDLELFVKMSDHLYGRANKCKKCEAVKVKAFRDAGKVRDNSDQPIPDTDINIPIRECKKCGLKAYTKEDLEEFQRAKGAKYGRANLCKRCAVKKTLNNKSSRPERTAEELEAYRKSQRKWHLKNTYGLTLEDYDKMLKAQNNKCKICGCEAYNSRNAFREYLVVDHCHTTGNVRGLLCHSCNIVLGSFNDNYLLVKNASKYLKEYL